MAPVDGVIESVMEMEGSQLGTARGLPESGNGLLPPESAQGAALVRLPFTWETQVGLCFPITREHMVMACSDGSECVRLKQQCGTLVLSWPTC